MVRHDRIVAEGRVKEAQKLCIILKTEQACTDNHFTHQH
jgi:hypothetical protein